ncbi:MAG: cysteine desulfurase family protein [Bacteroidetes bacterium]|nr:cysteine desulfurase family protein [Bacteroidota bacterium]
MRRPIYLDYNATTPHDPEVIEAMKPYLKEFFGNPSSANYFGTITRNAIDKARLQISLLLNCSPGEIVFTSGGTETNNLAIKGIALANKHRGNHIITSAVEHPAVLEVCRDLEKNGFKITCLPVNNIGIIEINEVEKAVRGNTILITVMHANNETGAIQPITGISAIAGSGNIFLHTDAAQSIGKIPVDVEELGIDLLSVAGHKLYAPKGIGALYIKKGTSLNKVILGAGQEKGIRPGTENILGIVGLGKACEIANRDFLKNHEHLINLRNMMYNGLKENLQENLQLNGDLDQILPNTLNLSFKGITSNEMIAALNDKVVLSAGAACHSGITKISEVLQAMNIPEEWAKGAVRISVGRFTTEQEVGRAIGHIVEAFQKLRK